MTPRKAPSSLLFRYQTLHQSITLLIGLLPLLVACNPIHLLSQKSEMTWNMQVVRSNTPGQYTIAGQAELPDRTPLTIIAVRYLHLDQQPEKNTNPTYSILAYQTTLVMNGQWQTNLNLWQVASNGQYQESWQREQQHLNLNLKPDEAVAFLATLAPVDSLPKIEQMLANQGLQLPKQQLRTTLEGDRFAQLNQTLEVALPVGETTPAIPALDDRNDGWGERYLIPKEPQNPTRLTRPENRQTNAPPRTVEFLQ